MSERIDHVNDAMACLIAADGHLSAEMPRETGEYKSDVIAVAQVHATLALVEQQRIANLIALSRIECENSSTPTDALDTLYSREEMGVWGETVKLHTRTEIAVLLGIKLKEESK